MDRNEVKRRALLGAAKVAFSASLAACGGLVIVEPGTSQGAGGASTTTSGNEKPETSATTAATTSAATTAIATASSGTPSACFDAAGQEDVGCCDALIEATFPIDGSPMGPTTSDVVGCCSAELAAKSASTGGSQVPYTQLYACCSVPGVVKANPACSPWGPPVPPSMPVGFDWLDEAA